MTDTNIGNWEIFEDRVDSLLARWKQFKRMKKGSGISDQSIIRSCLAEINDGFTDRLMEPDKESVDMMVLRAMRAGTKQESFTSNSARMAYEKQKPK